MKETLTVALMQLIVQLEDLERGEVSLSNVDIGRTERHQKGYQRDINALSSLRGLIESNELFDNSNAEKREFFKYAFFRCTYDSGYPYTKEYLSDLNGFVAQYREYLDSKGYLKEGG